MLFLSLRTRTGIDTYDCSEKGIINHNCDKVDCQRIYSITCSYVHRKLLKFVTFKYQELKMKTG